MRKIEEQMVAAFRAANQAFSSGRAKSWKNGNTEVRVGSATIAVYLFGHAIFQAVYPEAPSVARYRLEFSLAGFNTVTTRSRINALLDAYTYGDYQWRLFTYRGVPYVRKGFRKEDGIPVSVAVPSYDWVTVRSEP